MCCVSFTMRCETAMERHDSVVMVKTDIIILGNFVSWRYFSFSTYPSMV